MTLSLLVLAFFEMDVPLSCVTFCLMRVMGVFICQMGVVVIRMLCWLAHDDVI